MSELERLKADLEVLQRHQGYSILENAIADIADKIARLEAEADPWREAKQTIDGWRKEFDGYDDGWRSGGPRTHVVKMFDHLTAEVDRLTKRVAKLEKDNESAGRKCNELYEAKRNAELQRDKAWKRIEELEDVKDPADMQPPFEGPIVGIEPVLDPARVLLTAIGILAGEREFRASASISDVMFRLGLSATKPYPLKGETEAKWQEMERTAWGQGS